MRKLMTAIFCVLLIVASPASYAFDLGDWARCAFAWDCVDAVDDTLPPVIRDELKKFVPEGPISVDTGTGSVTFSVPYGEGQVTIDGKGGVSIVTPAVPDILKPVVEAARQAGDQALEEALRNGVELAEDLGREFQVAVQNSISTHDKAIGDMAANLIKSSNDVIDAGAAIARYAEREVTGIGDTLTDAEKRIREGKVVDALWHLGTQPLQNTERNAAQLAQENAWVAAAMQAAASTYGGPAGSAAFAAWMAYRQSGGNFEVALRAGIMAYATRSGYADVSTMPTGTMGQLLEKSAAAGAVSGIAVAASGGTTEDSINAFIKGGSAVVVQAGQAYVESELIDPAKATAQSYIDQAKAEADSFCMTAVDMDCAAAVEWANSAKADIEAARNALTSGPTIVVSEDGNWAVSWSRQSLNASNQAVPSVALTYVGEGSSTRQTLTNIAALTDPGLAQNAWVAFRDVGVTTSFFSYDDPSKSKTSPEVGDVLIARRDINIRRANGNVDWSGNIGTLSTGTRVVVLEVRKATPLGSVQEWIRFLPITN